MKSNITLIFDWIGDWNKNKNKSNRNKTSTHKVFHWLIYVLTFDCHIDNYYLSLYVAILIRCVVVVWKCWIQCSIFLTNEKLTLRYIVFACRFSDKTLVCNVFLQWLLLFFSHESTFWFSENYPFIVFNRIYQRYTEMKSLT